MGASAGEIRVADAYVDIGGKLDKFEAAIVAAGAKFVALEAKGARTAKAIDANLSEQAFKGFMHGTARLSAIVGAGASAVLAPFALGLREIAASGDEVYKASMRIGITPRAYASLGFAARLSGADVGAMAMAVRFTSKNIYAATEGNTKLAKAYRDVGLSASELADLAPDEQFTRVMVALGGVENKSKRTALAVQLLGRSGNKMLPMIADGANGVKELLAEYEHLYGVWDYKKADKFGDDILRAKTAAMGLARALGEAVLPEANAAAISLTNMFVSARKFAGQHPGLSRDVAGSAVVVAGASAVVGLAAMAALAYNQIAKAAGDIGITAWVKGGGLKGAGEKANSAFAMPVGAVAFSGAIQDTMRGIQQDPKRAEAFKAKYGFYPNTYKGPEASDKESANKSFGASSWITGKSDTGGSTFSASQRVGEMMGGTGVDIQMLQVQRAMLKALTDMAASGSGADPEGMTPE